MPPERWHPDLGIAAIRDQQMHPGQDHPVGAIELLALGCQRDRQRSPGRNQDVLVDERVDAEPGAEHEQEELDAFFELLESPLLAFLCHGVPYPRMWGLEAGSRNRRQLSRRIGECPVRGVSAKSL